MLFFCPLLHLNPLRFLLNSTQAFEQTFVIMVKLKSSGETSLRLSIAIGALAGSSVVLRLIVKINKKLQLGIEDWLVISALVLFYVYVGVLVQSMSPIIELKSLTKRLINQSRVSGEWRWLPSASRIDPSANKLLAQGLVDFIPCKFEVSNTDAVSQNLYITEIIFSTTITAVKISILCFYRSIFATPSFRRATLVLGIICMLWFIIIVFIGIFQCRPISGAWDYVFQVEDKSRCIPIAGFIFGYELSNVLLDICILCLPIYMIRRLQLPTRRKISVGSIFLLGGL